MSTVYQKTRLALIVCVIGFVATEFILRVFPTKEKNKEWLDMSHTQELKSEPWYEQWWQEHENLKREFQVYEMYRTQSHQGKLLNIGPNGYRKTWNSPQKNSNYRIGILGGSNMWGGGVRDNYTVASQLSKNLYQNHPQKPIEVINYSEVGFVFSQSLHRAVRILYSEQTEDFPPPKIMVFLSLTNDIAAAINNFSRGVEYPAGLPWEYDRYQYLYKLGDTCEIGTADILKKFKTIRSGLRVMASQGWIPPERKGFWRDPTPDQVKKVGQQVADKYLKLVHVAHVTLKGFGIRPIVILPPVLSKKATLSDDEQKIYDANKHVHSLITETYDRIKENSENLPEDIEFLIWENLFQGNASRYVDLFHYSERGHREIAEALVNYLSPTFESQSMGGKVS